MKLEKIALVLVLIGALVHGVLGLGQAALLSVLSPILPIVQIVVGVSGVYLIAKGLKFIK